MTISDSQKVDLLWKKIGFGRVKTDTNDLKKAPNEVFVSKPIIDPLAIWSDASSIPNVIPTSNTSIVKVYTTIQTTEDLTSTTRRTWTTSIVNWIPPVFGSTYQLKVYSALSSAANPVSSGTQLFETGSGNNDEWYFDYQSGVLNFIGSNLPTSVTSGKGIFLSGAVYTGQLGLSGVGLSDAVISNASLTDSNISNTNITDGTLNNVTINSLSNPLEVKDGGTGIRELVEKGVMSGANTTTVAFTTGSQGQILQYDVNGAPIADDIDGGNY
tara:strand:- start:757 stop:1569 length:813 start_codon:yes stop_codon:yes gene_type:complete